MQLHDPHRVLVAQPVGGRLRKAEQRKLGRADDVSGELASVRDPAGQRSAASAVSFGQPITYLASWHLSSVRMQRHPLSS